MNCKNIGNYKHLYWSIKSSLLGEEFPKLIDIAFEWRDNHIVIYFYHDGKLSDDDTEKYSDVTGEVISHYDSPVMIGENFLEWASSKPLPNREHWFFSGIQYKL